MSIFRSEIKLPPIDQEDADFKNYIKEIEKKQNRPWYKDWRWIVGTVLSIVGLALGILALL
jgi:hypothetical protein